MKLVKLKLKAGICWTGSLKVVEAHPDGRFTVAFDAADKTHFIYDHTVMDAAQLLEWTGVEVSTWWPQDANGRPPKAA